MGHIPRVVKRLLASSKKLKILNGKLDGKDQKLKFQESQIAGLRKDLDSFEIIIKQTKKEKHVVEMNYRKKIVEIEEIQRKHFIGQEELRENFETEIVEIKEMHSEYVKELIQGFEE